MCFVGSCGQHFSRSSIISEGYPQCVRISYDDIKVFYLPTDAQKQVIEGKIKGEMEVARRRGRRRKKLLDDLKDKRGYSNLKEDATDRTMWRHRFGAGFGPVVRQITG